MGCWNNWKNTILFFFDAPSDRMAIYKSRLYPGSSQAFYIKPFHVNLDCEIIGKAKIPTFVLTWHYYLKCRHVPFDDC